MVARLGHLLCAVLFREISIIFSPMLILKRCRYLQNGNILAARTFITHFVSALPRSFYVDPSPITVDPGSEVILTTDSEVNFSQMAVLTCQRAQGDKNKVVRESWIRLCGTYQSRGGLLAQPAVRAVRSHRHLSRHSHLICSRC